MNNENQNTEYKRIWKDEYLKWVCGFANANGGKIYIGINDDMSVFGVSRLHQQLEDIPNKIVTNLGIVPEINHITKDNKAVIEIIIEPCNIPISYRGAYYYRCGATKQELRGVALHQFLLKKTGINWEDIPCHGATMNDIDPDAVIYFLKKSVQAQRMQPEAMETTTKEVLDNFGLLTDETPTHAAILLFGKNPQRFFVTSAFKIGRFGTNDHDLLYQDVIEGNLIQMTDKVIAALNDKYLIRPIHYEGLQRIEPLEIPEAALREMIFNSIVHKDQQGTWNQMSVYNDHIRLWNEGTLPDNYTIDNLLHKHTSKPRNPKIANIFYRAGFIEAWGRGIQKIIDGFNAEKLVPPTFQLEQNGITLLIPRERFMTLSASGSRVAGSQQNAAQSQRPKNDQKSDPKNDQKKRIIELIQSKPNISRTEIAIALNIHNSSAKRRLEALVTEGRIRRKGPAKGGSWEIIE